jgi:hypothetical protein
MKLVCGGRSGAGSLSFLHPVVNKKAVINNNPATLERFLNILIILVLKVLKIPKMGRKCSYPDGISLMG